MKQKKFDIKTFFKSVNLNKEEFFSNSPPSIFVGSKLKYPAVNVGILTPQERVEDAWLFDAQDYWAMENYTIEDIIKFRTSLINSRFKTTVHLHKDNRFLNIAQEIGMASKPVDVEIKLDKKPHLEIDFGQIILPMGPRANLKSAKIAGNPKIPSKVDKVTADTDLKASEAIDYLYKNSFDERTLSQLLSIGILGLPKNRKLVPSRWSITCVDDVLSKTLIKSIHSYSEVPSYQLNIGSYLGNYYLVMFLPEVFSYELFEVYLPKSAWNETDTEAVATDYEDVYGRKSYASNTAGGYYATRMPIAEYLNKIKRKASVIAIRFETPEYSLGLGVFVVRESVRKALENKPLLFNSMEEMFSYVKRFVSERFNYKAEELLNKSKTLKNIKNQSSLTDFF